MKSVILVVHRLKWTGAQNLGEITLSGQVMSGVFRELKSLT